MINPLSAADPDRLTSGEQPRPVARVAGQWPGPRRFRAPSATSWTGRTGPASRW